MIGNSVIAGMAIDRCPEALEGLVKTKCHRKWFPVSTSSPKAICTFGAALAVACMYLAPKATDNYVDNLVYIVEKIFAILSAIKKQEVDSHGMFP